MIVKYDPKTDEKTVKILEKNIQECRFFELNEFEVAKYFIVD